MSYSVAKGPLLAGLGIKATISLSSPKERSNSTAHPGSTDGGASSGGGGGGGNAGGGKEGKEKDIVSVSVHQVYITNRSIY